MKSMPETESESVSEYPTLRRKIQSGALASLAVLGAAASLAGLGLNARGAASAIGSLLLFGILAFVYRPISPDCPWRDE